MNGRFRFSRSIRRKDLKPCQTPLMRSRLHRCSMTIIAEILRKTATTDHQRSAASRGRMRTIKSKDLSLTWIVTKRPQRCHGQHHRRVEVGMAILLLTILVIRRQNAKTYKTLLPRHGVGAHTRLALFAPAAAQATNGIDSLLRGCCTRRRRKVTLNLLPLYRGMNMRQEDISTKVGTI